MAEAKRKWDAYAVFDGGGVAGIAHAAALKTAPEQYKFIGFAGTSAGSIVAAIAAAGMTPDEMIAALRNTPLKSLVGPERHVTQLLQTLAVRCVETPLRMHARLPRSKWVLVRALAIVASIGVLLIYFWRLLEPGWQSDLTTRFGLASHGTVLAGGAVGLTTLMCFNWWLGVVPKRKLEKFVLEQIQSKLPAFTAETTFDEFEAMGGLPLRIFATNVSSSRPVMFCSQRGQSTHSELETHNISVVKAVSASSSFPFFFWAEEIRDQIMTDGGLSCNLPTFAFNEELRTRRVPVIAFDLMWKSRVPEHRMCITEFAGRLFTSAIQSHDTILKGLSSRVGRVEIAVPESIDVLDFNLKPDQQNDLIEAGEKAAADFLDIESSSAVAVAQTEVEFVRSQYVPERIVKPLLQSMCVASLSELGTADPRAAIFLPVSANKLKVIFHTFALEDKDSELELTLQEGLAGRAWSRRGILVGRLPEFGLRSRPELQAQVRLDRKAGLCVPIFNVDVGTRSELSEERLGVLALDSSASIEEMNWQANSDDVIKFAKRWADTFALLFRY